MNALARPVDAASLWVARRAFGVLGVILVARYFAHDWIAHYFLEPTFFFTYLDAWRPLPAPWPYVEFTVLGLAALALAMDVAPRVAAGIFFVLFTHQHFSDKAIYLNHYYLVSLLALLFALLPVAKPDRAIAAGWLWAFRAQLAVVYFYGGVGKLNTDWLLRGEPLRTWLHASSDLPVLGALFAENATAYVFAWGGALFDLTIVAWLLWRKTRAPAYVVLVAFHVVTALLFPIGLFPWLMIGAATLFWDPAWPRRWLRRDAPLAPPVPTPRPLVALLVLHLALQGLLPLRSWFTRGDVNWTEAGFRFSWKVMLTDKAGVADFRVVTQSGRVFEVNPRALLTPLQTRMMATQPDMIMQLARHLATRYAAQTGEPVDVFATVLVGYNGRPPRALVPADVPLAHATPGKL